MLQQPEDRPASSGTGGRAWAAALEAVARDAAAIFPPEQWGLSLGGADIDVRAIGGAIPGWLLPALEHARRSDQSAGTAIKLTIWDQADTGIAPPMPFWGIDGWANRGELPALADSRTVAAFHEDAGYLGVFDTERRQAWVWVRDAARVPRYERAAPLRGPLSWLLSANGAQLAHAGAVATSRGAALLAGPGGSGKSTTTMACLASGLGFLGDDYVLVRQDGDTPTVHMLYATAKLTERAFDLLPALRPLADGPGTADDKAVLHLAGTALGTGLVDQARIAAIILPCVGTGEATCWERASAAQALIALAPTTLFQLPGAGAGALSRLAALVRAVPAFTIRLGSGMAAIPSAVAAIIAAASETGGGAA